MLSRIFCQKRVRENFRNFHTVLHLNKIPFLQIFCQRNILQKNFTFNWFDENQPVNFSFSTHHSVENENITLTEKKIRQINYFVSKIVTYTKIFAKQVWESNSLISTLCTHSGNYGNLLSHFFCESFVNVTVSFYQKITK